MYAMTVEGGTKLHYVDGDIPRNFNSRKTLCGREMRPQNVFLSLDDYRQGFNMHGEACAQCEECA